MMNGSFESLRDLARQHLSPEVAERWLGLLRPTCQLEAASGSEQVVGQLGGLPKMPADAEWPVWPGHGPLSFIASVDCEALPTESLDIALPADGTLLFFYFDGQLDDGDALVYVKDRDSWAGARVVYVPAGSVCTERPAPEGLSAYPHVPLTARLQVTAAEPELPQVQQLLAPERPPTQWFERPVHGDTFAEALSEHNLQVGHRLGGYASPVQGPVELEVADAVLGGALSWNDPKLAQEASDWLLLAQFDSNGEADMMWGDCGALYWLIRAQDLAERRFDRTMFTWQCS